MMNRQKTNLSDIANRCGVSKPTVSRVLNSTYNGFSVRPELKEKILRIAKEMNYQPNILAKKLKLQQTHLVGLLGYQISYARGIYSRIVDIAVQKLHEYGYQVFAEFPIDDQVQYPFLPSVMDAAMVVHNCDINAIEKSNIPYVVINNIAGISGSCIQTDDATGTYLAMEHLFELGHTKIAYKNISNERSSHSSVESRCKAYKNYMINHGLKPAPGYDKMSSVPEFFINHILNKDISAVLAYSSSQAIDLIWEATRHGLKIPEDLSVIGFNDLPDFMVRLGLTTISLNEAKMGTMAADMLYRSIKEPGYREEVIVPEKLIVRKTTAPPRILTSR
jgi:LacI family transcriptional regulator, repressor for deo operon, udp, cdd, tsx, nupC, and nupG